MYCRSCGAEIPNHAKFCPDCGIKIIVENDPPPEKISAAPTESYRYVSAQNRTIAMLLCSLGVAGIAGLHRIYVGKWTSGVLYLLTFGGLLLGTLYDLYQLYCGGFKDRDGYPLFGADMMKENYRRRTPKFPKYYHITAPLAAILMISTIGTNIVKNHSEPPKPTQEAAAPKSPEELLSAQIKESIQQTVYIPKPEDHDRGAWYAKIENTSNQRFKGRINIKNESITEGVKTHGFNLNLAPREAQYIAGIPPAPADGTIDSVITGQFLEPVYEKSPDLDYHIISSGVTGDGKLTHYEMYVNVPPNTPDQTYLQIAKEVKHNYADKYALVTIRFCDVGINPNTNDTKVIFSHNNILKHSRVIFYTADETNMRLLPDSASERKIVNIGE